MSEQPSVEQLADDLYNNIWDTEDVPSVQPFFDDLQNFSEEIRSAVIASFEARMISDLFREIPDHEEGREERLYMIKEFPEVERHAYALSEILLNISQVLGDKAHPFVKAYVEEMAKLSDEEYTSSPEKHAMAVFEAYDKANGIGTSSVAPAPISKPKTNPFRPKPPGAM